MGSGYKRLIGRMVEVFTEERGIEVESAGSTTFKREDLARGLEPDECYYLQHAAAVRVKDEIDLTVNPPPDLVIEERCKGGEPENRGQGDKERQRLHHATSQRSACTQCLFHSRRRPEQQHLGKGHVVGVGQQAAEDQHDEHHQRQPLERQWKLRQPKQSIDHPCHGLPIRRT